MDINLYINMFNNLIFIVTIPTIKKAIKILSIIDEDKDHINIIDSKDDNVKCSIYNNPEETPLLTPPFITAHGCGQETIIKIYGNKKLITINQSYTTHWFYTIYFNPDYTNYKSLIVESTVNCLTEAFKNHEVIRLFNEELKQTNINTKKPSEAELKLLKIMEI